VVRTGIVAMVRGSVGSLQDADADDAGRSEGHGGLLE
jgi:hypothetical protein